MLTQTFDFLVPDWPAPANVRALCTTRSGGVSEGCYAGLNLGLHVGDAPEAVQRNRAVLQTQLGVRAVFLDQVHGADVLDIHPGLADGMVADGATIREPGLACVVMVADCLPVLLCDAQGHAVAAAHAGWRGLLGRQGRGVLEAAVASFTSIDGARAAPHGLMAWLGPCIGPDAFEVGDEVRMAFVSAWPQAAACFRPQSPGKWLADLPGLARQRLFALGVTRIFGNDGGAEWCTVANPSRFFSHRRDGISGRLAACIWRID
jgi:YfiH family protein